MDQILLPRKDAGQGESKRRIMESMLVVLGGR
jgi:hypothetical protein